jgi:hypothetical protein
VEKVVGENGKPDVKMRKKIFGAVSGDAWCGYYEKKMREIVTEAPPAAAIGRAADARVASMVAAAVEPDHLAIDGAPVIDEAPADVRACPKCTLDNPRDYLGLHIFETEESVAFETVEAVAAPPPSNQELQVSRQLDDDNSGNNYGELLDQLGNGTENQYQNLPATPEQLKSIPVSKWPSNCSKCNHLYVGEDSFLLGEGDLGDFSLCKPCVDSSRRDRNDSMCPICKEAYAVDTSIG